MAAWCWEQTYKNALFEAESKLGVKHTALPHWITERKDHALAPCFIMAIRKRLYIMSWYYYIILGGLQEHFGHHFHCCIALENAVERSASTSVTGIRPAHQSKNKRRLNNYVQKTPAEWYSTYDDCLFKFAKKEKIKCIPVDIIPYQGVEPCATAHNHGTCAGWEAEMLPIHQYGLLCWLKCYSNLCTEVTTKSYKTGRGYCQEPLII